ncbi:trypsin-like serine peptidase [Zavarzinia sp. CC-PAN008]|uniref:trypsin-like serine peptidase n=1 Tax=Zavarzinia sp. CC-PAN008 TaxID=3243332 RepID=UPI003F74324F
MKTMLCRTLLALAIGSGALMGGTPAQAFDAGDALQTLQGTWKQRGGKCSEPDYIWTRQTAERFRYVCIPTSLGSCDFDDVAVQIKQENDKVWFVQYPRGANGEEVWERFRIRGPDAIEFFESAAGYSYSIERCSAATDAPAPRNNRPGPVDGGPKPPVEKSSTPEDADHLFGHDDRTFPDVAQAPWSAIGKLTFAGGGYCTAQLVAPRVILTAAHCMYEGETSNELAQPEAFLAGFRDGRALASARIVSWEIASGYDHERHITTSEIDGLDYAFLTLDRDLGTRLGTFDIRPMTDAEVMRLEKGSWLTVSLAGYSSDHEDRMTAHVGCHVVQVYDDNTLFHECDTQVGASGAALFVNENGRYRIVAIHSAYYPSDDSPFEHSMAVDSRAFYRAARRILDRHS